MSKSGRAGGMSNQLGEEMVDSGDQGGEGLGGGCDQGIQLKVEVGRFLVHLFGQGGGVGWWGLPARG